MDRILDENTLARIQYESANAPEKNMIEIDTLIDNVRRLKEALRLSQMWMDCMPRHGLDDAQYYQDAARIRELMGDS